MVGECSGVETVVELQMSNTSDVGVVGVTASGPRILTFSQMCTPAASKTSTIGAWARTFCILRTYDDFNLFVCPSTTKTTVNHTVNSRMV